MKKLLKVLGILVLSMLVILILIIAYIKIALPNVGPAPDMKVEYSVARLNRGKYLANHVMVCMDCHSIRNPSLFSMPMDESTRGGGGQRFDQTEGFPGIFYSANITPFGIGSWTDGEIYRAITTGVRKNGKPLFPVMPYHNFGYANPEDIKSIIVYLRSLPPKENRVPESSADFPMNILLNTIPQKAKPLPVPPAGDSLAKGYYLSTLASCYDCHTPFEKGKYDKNFSFAGGRSFPVLGGKATSVNITPDNETGLGQWTREMFIQRFTGYRDSAMANRAVKPGEYQSIMPWTMYAMMTDADLSSIYTYLRTIKPIKHLTAKFQASN